MDSSWSDDDLIALFHRVSNVGRWGPNDELGTLNHITPAKRRQAAALVLIGETISLSSPISRRQIEHRMSYHHVPGHPLRPPPSAGDYLGFEVHQPGLTHLDCVNHIGSHEGLVYSGQSFDSVAAAAGLTHGSIYAQRAGILSRGVLLDVASALQVDRLEPMHSVSVSDLEAAERLGGVQVSTGDVVVIRVGTDAREAVNGSSPLSPGPGPDCIEWFHERQISVYTGDAPERLTPVAARILGLLPTDDAASAEPGRHDTDGTRFPLPLHQIGIPAMGLVLLDHCFVEDLALRCRALSRYEFMFFAAPLAVPGATGSPVNPIAVF